MGERFEYAGLAECMFARRDSDRVDEWVMTYCADLEYQSRSVYLQREGRLTRFGLTSPTYS
jgi:hypothetical protein